MKARFYKEQSDHTLQCVLCPHKCVIRPGKYGMCRVRTNDHGTLKIPFYGKLSALALDPIEKKPLYHYFPGKMILSAGFWGCSLRCPFCQNHHISQHTGEDSEYIGPEKLVNLAKSRDSFGIAYTYSEPLIHMEYLIDTARLAKEKGIKNILVSNGYINPEPARELLPYLDAANIDLKSFNSEFYRKELGGNLEPVKNFLSLAAGSIHLEVTTLVIPTKNDTPGEIGEIAGFLASLSPDIPFHLSCYHPMYMYTIPATSTAAITALADEARKYLRYVYLGNVGVTETNTSCPSCGALLIRRRGYTITPVGIKNRSCATCGYTIPIPGIP